MRARLRAGACLAALVGTWPLPALAEAHPLRFSVRAPAAASGRVTAFDGSSVTIQTPGRTTGVVNGLISTAQTITRQDLPYVWGGGHESAGTPSSGIPGPGFNGHRKGYDCSGAVAAVLVGGGLWPAGAGVPSEAGMISELRAQGLIVPGVGHGPVQVTLYDNPGVHIFMNVNGRFFGTSDGGGGNSSQRRGGAGWLDDGAPDASSSSFKRFHFIASALHGSTTSSRSLTFQLGALNGPIATFLTGDRVRVTYQAASTGAMFARSIQLLGTSTASGTVTKLDPSGTSLTLLTSKGKVIELQLASGSLGQAELALGDVVTVTYTTGAGGKLARSLSVTSVPSPAGAGSPSTGQGVGSGDGSGSPTSGAVPGSPGPAGAAGSSGAAGAPGSTGSSGATGSSGTAGSGTDTVTPGNSGYGPGAGWVPGGSGHDGWSGYDYGAGGYPGYARDAG